MDYRYVIIGINIIALSIAYILLSLGSPYESLLGIGFSTFLLGLILLIIGITYVEPLDKLYQSFYNIMYDLFSLLLEDSGLLYTAQIKTCFKNDVALLLVSGKNVECDSVNSGIGVIGGSPYIALPISHFIDTSIAQTSTSSPDIESLIRTYITGYLHMAKDVSLSHNKNQIKVELYGVRKEILSTMKNPINPTKIILLSLLTLAYAKGLRVIDEKIVEDSYSLSVEVT